MTIYFHEFPILQQDGYDPKSEPTTDYNCIAYAAGVEDQWWQPGWIWPDDLPDDDFSMMPILMYRRKGFDLCDKGDLEPGFEKIALFGAEDEYQHAARNSLTAVGRAS